MLDRIDIQAEVPGVAYKGLADHSSSESSADIRARVERARAIQLERFRGREVKMTGDGFLARFDGPARAIRCASAIVNGAKPLGLEVRAGVHTGECELRGDDLAGIAVHIAARICAAAPPGGVLVSGVVKDLVAGSGINFEDRGIRTLQGCGEWRLFAVPRESMRGDGRRSP